MSQSTPADDDVEDADPADLRARIDVLQEENRRLRAEYARARRSQYRRTALALLAVGLVALAGAALVDVTRDVLLVLGAIGVFAAVLTFYLTPERFVPASVGERVYAARADTAAGVVAALGLSETRVYVPTPPGAAPDEPAWLFVPQHSEHVVPDPADLEEPFVVTDDDRERGLSVTPTGGELFAEFSRVLSGPLAETPSPLADQLVDALVEQFELVDGARLDLDADGGRLTVGISGSTYGAVDRFDHPVVSFLGVGAAVGLDRPVETSVAAGDDRTDHLVTVRWADG